MLLSFRPGALSGPLDNEGKLTLARYRVSPEVMCGRVRLEKKITAKRATVFCGAKRRSWPFSCAGFEHA